MSEWRVGLVGAGGIARAHVSALRRVPGVRIVGVADPDVERSRVLAAEFGVSHAVGDFESLLERGVDVVHVLTPPELHEAVGSACLAAGCHVYIEKPLATSVEAVDRLIDAAAAADRTIGVGHSLLRDPIVMKAMALVERGVIGPVRSAHYRRRQGGMDYGGGPMPDVLSRGGGPFRDVGVHGVYLLESLIGRIAHADTLVSSVRRLASVYCDDWHVQCRASRGTGSLHLSWHVGPPESVIVIEGERGTIRADLFAMSVTIRPVRVLPSYPTRLVNALLDGLGGSWQVIGGTVRVVTGRVRRYHGVQALIEEFYDRLSSGQPPPVALEAARSAVDWTERIAGHGDQLKADWLASFPAPRQADVLVTGAAGLIGTPLVERMLAEGRRVRLLVRREPKESWRLDPRVEIVPGDLGDPDAVRRAVGGVDTVFHLGATMRGSAAEFEGGTVVGTRNVVEACLEAGIRRLVYVSSLAVLDAVSPSSTPISESWPLEPRPELRGAYSRTKLAAEAIVREAVSSRGLPAVIVRPGEVLGRSGPTLTAGVGLRVGKHIATIGRGIRPMALVSVDDVVEALVLAARASVPVGTIVHLVDPAGVTCGDMARALVNREGRGGRVLTMPIMVLRGLALGVGVLARLARRPAPLTTYRVRALATTRAYDCQRAREVLGWLPRDDLRAWLESPGPATRPR